MKEALFYEQLDGAWVKCHLCQHSCLIAPGRSGLCRVRTNREGTLVSEVYGYPIAEACDPIEKKPLYHFLPGTRSYSISTCGCNFHCLNCQNSTISQAPAPDLIAALPFRDPSEIAAEAESQGCASIAHTYTEPTVFYEYAHDIAIAARERGIRTVFVTNGYISEIALRHIATLLDAVNIDLKFFDDDLYRRVCGARLDFVLDSIRLHHELGIWMEITTLVIPGYNDDHAQLARIAEFIAGIDPQIPWHVSAFRPTYKMKDPPPTPNAALETAREIGRQAGLRHIYLGNTSLTGAGTTRCPGCHAALIERHGYTVTSNLADGGRCPACGTPLAGVWS